MRSPSAASDSGFDPDAPEDEDEDDGGPHSVGLPDVAHDGTAAPASQAFLPRPLHDLFGADRGRLALLVTGKLVATTASMIPAFSMGMLIDTAFAHRAPAQLWIVIGLLVAAHVVETLAERWCRRMLAAVRADRVAKVTADVVARIEAAPLAAIEAQTSATVLGRLRSIPRIVAFYVHWYVLIVSRPVFFVAAMAWLLAENLILGGAILAMTLVYVRLYWMASQRLRAQFLRETQRAEARAHALHEFAHGLLTLRIAGEVGRFYRALESRRRPAPGQEAPAAGAQAWLVGLTRSYSSVGFIAVLALGASLVIAGELSVGQLLIANVLFRRILSETRYVVGRVRRYYRTRTAADIVGRFLDSLAAAPAVADPGGVLPDFERIALRQVDVHRPGVEAPVLAGVDLDIQRGEFVVLVGASGGGKTTLLKTIAGLYPPSAGTLEHVGSSGGRVRFAYVSAADTVFNRSVHHNIALHATLSRAAVVQAARDALADSFVARLEQGYDTRLRNYGGGLSQGQKLRIGLARGLATGARVMLLDEPTGALDPASEQRFLERLRDLRRERTIVMVTHRPAPALEADRVVVVAAGRVVETGTPQALLADPASAFSAWLRASSSAPACAALPVVPTPSIDLSHAS